MVLEFLIYSAGFALEARFSTGNHSAHYCISTQYFNADNFHTGDFHFRRLFFYFLVLASLSLTSVDQIHVIAAELGHQHTSISTRSRAHVGIDLLDSSNMASASPPRKKPRLLAKGNAKIGALFLRRQRTRHENTSESDFEDDQSILSRIDTAPLPQSSEESIEPNNSKHGDSGSSSDSQNEQDTRDDKAGKKAIKAQRRRGIIPTQDVLLPFRSENIISHGQPIARNPTCRGESRGFSFNMPLGTVQVPAGTEVMAAQTHDCEVRLKGDRISFTTHQPQLTGQDCVERSPAIRKNPLSGIFFPSTPELVDCLSRPQHQPAACTSASKGPLDHLKLMPVQPTAPRLDQAADIADIADYIRPRVPLPEAHAELYRNGAFRPELSFKTLHSTIPDWTEVAHFISDCESDKVSRFTEHGDVPAVSKREATRVPVGARLGKIGTSKDTAGDGDTNMTDTASIGLPLHVSGKGKRSKRNPDQITASPDSAYTSSGRVLDAYNAVRRARKRKRPSESLSLPPPDYIYQRTGRDHFNIFRDGILMLPELCLLLAASLPVQTLINLYSISKDFHIVLNQRFTTVILNQASQKAPNAARCYPWRCFKHLSQPDPALQAQTVSLAEQITTGDASHGNTNGAQINIKSAPVPPNNVLFARDSHLHPHTRRVPTFRWLHLAIYREKVIHALYHAFAARGVPLPGAPTDRSPSTFCNSLHKLWFIFDIPDNPRRIQYVHTHSLVSDGDLANILTFVVKLDMICNSPTGAEKRDGVRKLLMANCRGFETILKVVRREEWKNELDLFRAWTRYGFQLDREDGRAQQAGGGWVPLGLTPEEHEESKTVFGIPKTEVGILKREFWGALEYDREKKRPKSLHPGIQQRIREYGRVPMYLIRPDQLALREVVKRGYKFDKTFLDAVLVGYLDRRTHEPKPLRDLNGGRSRVLEAEGEYDIDDTIAGLRALSVEEGGDELLDLGSTWQGSSWTVVHQGPKKEELKRRKEEKEALEDYKAAWRQEVQDDQMLRASMAYRTFE